MNFDVNRIVVVVISRECLVFGNVSLELGMSKMFSIWECLVKCLGMVFDIFID